MKKHFCLLWLLCASLFSVAACATQEMPKIEIGNEFVFRGFVGGDVDNQIPVTDGQETFSYGQYCDINPENHRVIVLGTSGSEVQLLYIVTDPSLPKISSRECITGIRFVVSKWDYYDIIQKYENPPKN